MLAARWYWGPKPWIEREDPVAMFWRHGDSDVTEWLNRGPPWVRGCALCSGHSRDCALFFVCLGPWTPPVDSDCDSDSGLNSGELVALSCTGDEGHHSEWVYCTTSCVRVWENNPVLRSINCFCLTTSVLPLYLHQSLSSVTCKGSCLPRNVPILQLGGTFSPISLGCYSENRANFVSAQPHTSHRLISSCSSCSVVAFPC